MQKNNQNKIFNFLKEDFDVGNSEYTLKTDTNLTNFSSESSNEDSESSLQFTLSDSSWKENESAKMMIQFFENIKKKIDDLTKDELCFQIEYFLGKFEKKTGFQINLETFLEEIQNILNSQNSINQDLNDINQINQDY